MKITIGVYQEEETMGKKFWANIILCVFIGGVASVVLANIPTALTPKGLLVADPGPSSEAAPLMDKVILADYNLVENPGRMVNAEFIVNNSSDQDIKNVDVLCDFFDGADKYLDREQWLLSGSVPAGKTMRHTSAARRFVNTGSRGMKCQIVDFEVARAPFFELHRVEGGHGNTEPEGHEAAAQGHH